MSAIAMSRKRVAKNTASQVGAFAVSGATKAVVAVVVARSLGPQGFGTFMLAWTIASMVSFFAPLGLDIRLVRELNRGAGSSDVDASLFLATLSAVVLGAAVAIGPRIMGAEHELVAALTAAAGFIVLSAPVLILRGAFHAGERMELEAVTLTVEGVVGLAAVALVIGLGGSVALALVGLSIGRAANLAMSIFFYRNTYGPLRPRFAPSRWNDLLRVSMPMGFSYIFSSMMLRLDVVMLAMMRSPEEIGVYGAATVIIMTVPMVSAAFNTSLYPVLSRAKDESDPELRSMFDSAYKAQLMIGIVAAAGLAVLSGPIVNLLYGTGYGASASAIVALAAILPFRFVNNLSGVLLNATDRQKTRTATVGIAALTNFATNLVLIPLWGFRGAVVATLITELVLTVALRRVLGSLTPSLIGPLCRGGALASAVALTVAITPGHVLLRAALGAALFALTAAFVLWSRRVVRTSAGSPGLSDEVAA